MKEVELKIFVGRNGVEQKILEVLSAYGEPKISDQVDIYYTNTHKDFILTEECLRIRSVGGSDELTWKPPTTKDMLTSRQYWKEEQNIDITGKVDSFRYLLKNLDFIEYVVVAKHRKEYTVDGETKIAMDHIDGVGIFIEIETMSETAEIAARKNESLLATLNFEQAIRVSRPYRDIVKDGRIAV